jgi:predicted Zn-dependent protease
VEAGVYRQPLLAWHEARPAEARASGCSRRASWRDLPAAGPTHLYLAPRRGAAVGDLLAEVARGYYLLDAAGPVSLDEETATLEVPVCGFTLQSGAAVAPVGSLVLSTGVGTLLHGVQAVARDLTFFPWDGMIGSPTVLVTGVELRG